MEFKTSGISIKYSSITSVNWDPITKGHHEKFVQVYTIGGHVHLIHLCDSGLKELKARLQEED